MRIHYLQHMGCEGLGRIANWAAERGHAVSGTHLYRGDPLPNDDAFDCLVIMGGPMNIYEHRNHPWLTAEKPFIKRAIEIWSLPGELVFSPFGGIGSEGVGALETGRSALLMELKRSYFDIACRNLTAAHQSQETLFDAAS